MSSTCAPWASVTPVTAHVPRQSCNSTHPIVIVNGNVPHCPSSAA